MEKTNLFARLLIMVGLFLFLAYQTYAQGIKYTTVIGDTISDSNTKTGYIKTLHFKEKGDLYYEVTDSVDIDVIALGEIDLDQLIVTKGYYTGSTFYATATPDTTTLTINNAASTTTVVLTSATDAATTDLPKYDALRIKVVAASSGNDASDPNKVTVVARQHVRRMKSLGT